MFLAGDIGGTKTLLGLFGPGTERPAAVEVGEFTTLDYDSLEAIIREFLRAQNLDPGKIIATCFGVAGAVTDNIARLTNVPWLVDIDALAETTGLANCVLINDLQALGYAVPVLEPDELAVLQQGVASPRGNAAVIAAGTGLGEAMLHNIDGRFVPAASEGGHADFAPRTPREIEMTAALMRIFDHVSVEHVVSGPGLVNIYQFTHESFGSGPSVTPSSVVPARLCAGVGTVRDPADLPARISESAMEKRCSRCVEALDIFVDAYGSESGNLALRYVATGGVYVGGGIAPKILPAIEAGPFLEGFRGKGLMTDFVATVPVFVILNPDAGLLGAAVRAVEAAATQ
jgi:glucokinase